MNIKRRKTRVVKVGDILIGGKSPISIQSMTKTKTENVDDTIAQIKRLVKAGCDIVRLSVNSQKAALALKEIKKECPIPLVADIHFDYRLALKSIEAGVDKVRINPGNIGDLKKIQQVLGACKEREIPIRIGINGGSLEKDILKKTGYPTAKGMIESALKHIKICEKEKFENLIISLKSSHTTMMIQAYKGLSKIVDYPLHLGVTEAGAIFSGTIKSSIGIGALLAEGIGDTIRVSLTDEPEEEIKVGKEILKSLGLSTFGVTIVSCPTCGRLDVDLFSIVKEIEKKTANLKKNLRVAVMGCVVNGPGEAKDSDLGVACTKGKAFLFIKGKKIANIKENEIIPRLMEEIDKF